MSITAIGLANDPTLRHFLAECGEQHVDVELVDLHALVEGDWLFPLPGSDAQCRDGAAQRRLPASGRYYVRLIDLSSTCTGAGALAWQATVHGLSAWLQTIDGRVVNRPGFAQDNGSKPLHEALLARYGFKVPAAISSSDRAVLMAFAGEPTIIKTLSGVRADCWAVAPADFADFRTEQGPVHLQRRIAGRDIRAHVVADRVIAVEVASDTVDYRIDGDARYAPIELPERLRQRMVEAARAMGLVLSGWDFKVDADGDFWLLEANPMPGYNSYDRRLEGRITRAIVDVLQERPS